MQRYSAMLHYVMECHYRPCYATKRNVTMQAMLPRYIVCIDTRYRAIQSIAMQCNAMQCYELLG
eukprot:541989-Pyramimonas_sp.AAC.1